MSPLTPPPPPRSDGPPARGRTRLCPGYSRPMTVAADRRLTQCASREDCAGKTRRSSLNKQLARFAALPMLRALSAGPRQSRLAGHDRPCWPAWPAGVVAQGGARRPARAGRRAPTGGLNGTELRAWAKAQAIDLNDSRGYPPGWWPDSKGCYRTIQSGMLPAARTYRASRTCRCVPVYLCADLHVANGRDRQFSLVIHISWAGRTLNTRVIRVTPVLSRAVLGRC
jgi:hypothetical protein